MNNAQAMQRAIAVFCSRVASPGNVAWTERHDKLLTEVAQQFDIDEDELFARLMGGTVADLEPSYLPVMTPQRYTEIMEDLAERRRNGGPA